MSKILESQRSTLGGLGRKVATAVIRGVPKEEIFKQLQGQYPVENIEISYNRAVKKYSQKDAQPATRLRKAANGDVTDLYTRDGRLWGKVQVYSKVDNHEYEEKIAELEKTIADLTSLIESEEYQAFKALSKIWRK